MADFIETLKKKAEKIVKNIKVENWDNSIGALLQREIALTLDQIKQLRKCHQEQKVKLVDAECEIDTEIMQMEDRTPSYSSQKYPEREKYIRQLRGIKGERRRQEIMYEDKLQNLQRILLKLVHQYEQIKHMNNEHRQHSPKTGAFDTGNC